MKLVQILCLGILIGGMEIGAAERGLDTASETSSSDNSTPRSSRTASESEQLPLSNPSSPRSPRSEQVVKVSFAPKSEQASSPREHLKPPAPVLTIEDIEGILNDVGGKIPALRSKPGYRYIDYNNCRLKVQKCMPILNTHPKSDIRTNLTDRAKQLIKDLDAIQLKRGGELYTNLPKGYDLEEPSDENAFDSADSREKDEEVTVDTSASKETDVSHRTKATVFKWLLGTATVATVATIIWYLYRNKSLPRFSF